MAPDPRWPSSTHWPPAVSSTAIIYCTPHAPTCCGASVPRPKPRRATRGRWRWSPTTPSGAFSSAACTKSRQAPPDHRGVEADCDSGGSLSLATPIEMEMGHGIPPIQQALDHKIPWSLSNDVETEIPSDFFTQMRTNFFLQRMQIFARERAKEANVPPLLTVKDIVHVATIGGARANWLDKRTGSLTPGKEADVILLTASASNVDTVFVGGRAKKWQGQLVGADLDQLRTRSAQSRDYLLAQ